MQSRQPRSVPQGVVGVLLKPGAGAASCSRGREGQGGGGAESRRELEWNRLEHRKSVKTITRVGWSAVGDVGFGELPECVSLRAGAAVGSGGPTAGAERQGCPGSVCTGHFLSGQRQARRTGGEGAARSQRRRARRTLDGVGRRATVSPTGTDSVMARSTARHKEVQPFDSAGPGTKVRRTTTEARGKQLQGVREDTVGQAAARIPTVPAALYAAMGVSVHSRGGAGGQPEVPDGLATHRGGVREDQQRQEGVSDPRVGSSTAGTSAVWQGRLDYPDFGTEGEQCWKGTVEVRTRQVVSVSWLQRKWIWSIPRCV